MGNESSILVKFRQRSEDNDKPPLIIECHERVTHAYKKKAPRNVSHTRCANDARKLTQLKYRTDDDVTLTKNSINSPRNYLSTNSSTDSLLCPPASERRRSRSVCIVEVVQDSQKTALTTTKLTESDLKSENNASENTVMSGGNGRKGSSGLLPSLNRIRIQHCFKAARPTIGEAILKRASNNRSEMRILMSRLTDQQIELMGKQFYMLIAYSVENIERVEMIQQHARTLGETYAALCRLGFRPDYFTSLADAAIAECVKLDGGTHKRCETLLAWSQLIGAIFTSVRDGYYSRVRYQRRSSLPHNLVTKQQSVDLPINADQRACIQ